MYQAWLNAGAARMAARRARPGRLHERTMPRLVAAMPGGTGIMSASAGVAEAIRRRRERMPRMRSATSPRLHRAARCCHGSRSASRRREDTTSCRRKQAYKYTVEATQGDVVRPLSTSQPGYYLYRDRLGFESATPWRHARRAASLPVGEDHEDEYFGKQVIYRGDDRRSACEVTFDGAPRRLRPAR